MLPEMPAARKTSTRSTAKKTATNETRITGMRIPPRQLAEIDRRAKRHKLTRTEYMIRSALGEPLDQRTVDQRIAELEQRVAALDSALSRREAADSKEPGEPGSSTA